MNILFSLVSILIVVGTLVWWFNFQTSSVIENNNPVSGVEINNQITDPIKSAQDAKEQIEIKTGATLDYSNQALSKVPESVFSQTGTRVLNLSNNNLSGALPGEIRFLSNLRVLDLSDNNFTGVPAEVGQLSQLEELDLSNNSLTGLPYELGNLQNLKALNLTGNDYAQVDLDIIKAKLPANVTIITK